ncbi:hypothetical protein ABIG05_007862 [Bradyrhizobium japonicum]
MLWGSVMEEFYGSFAQRARELAEKADPFTRRRLLGLAKKYDAKSRPSGSARPLPTAGTTHASNAFLRHRRSLKKGRPPAGIRPRAAALFRLVDQRK